MISFIVPTHNYGYMLNKCISSILKNEKKYIREILIINDASQDNTDKIVKNILKNKKIKYYKKNFRNLGKTTNFGISKAKGNLICKIDADDIIKKKFAEDNYLFMKKKNADFVFSNILVNDLLKKKKYLKVQKLKNFFSILSYPHGSGCLFKKRIWKKVGKYNQKNFYQDDFDFWLKIKKLKNIKIEHLDKALYVYNKHNNNMSKNFLIKNLTKLKILIKHLLI